MLENYSVIYTGKNITERVNIDQFMRRYAVEYLLERPDLMRRLLNEVDTRRMGPRVLKSGMTKKQREALDFIYSYQKHRRYCPSFQEIMEAMNLRSKSGVHRIVHALRDRGYIKLTPNCARSIEIVEGKRQADFMESGEAV